MFLSVNETKNCKVGNHNLSDVVWQPEKDPPKIYNTWIIAN